MSEKNHPPFFHLALSVILILLIGLCAGFALGYTYAAKKSFPEIRMVGEINDGFRTP